MDLDTFLIQIFKSAFYTGIRGRPQIVLSIGGRHKCVDRSIAIDTLDIPAMA